MWEELDLISQPLDALQPLPPQHTHAHRCMPHSLVHCIDPAWPDKPSWVYIASHGPALNQEQSACTGCKRWAESAWRVWEIWNGALSCVLGLSIHSIPSGVSATEAAMLKTVSQPRVLDHELGSAEQMHLHEIWKAEEKQSSFLVYAFR